MKKDDLEVPTVDVNVKEPISKKKTSIFVKIVNTVIWILIIILFYSISFGLININKLQKDQKQLFLIDTKEYVKDGKNLKIYNFGPYKIVNQDNETKNVYSLKLWFFNDLSK